MGRKKSKIDPKQKLLSPDLKLRSPLKAKEKLKPKIPLTRQNNLPGKKRLPGRPPKVPAKSVSEKSTLRSQREEENLPIRSPNRSKGRPKPQAKASAKLKSDSLEESFDEKYLDQSSNNNNNNNNNNDDRNDKSLPLNNNNADKSPSPTSFNKKKSLTTNSKKESATKNCLPLPKANLTKLGRGCLTTQNNNNVDKSPTHNTEVLKKSLDTSNLRKDALTIKKEKVTSASKKIISHSTKENLSTHSNKEILTTPSKKSLTAPSKGENSDALLRKEGMTLSSKKDNFATSSKDVTSNSKKNVAGSTILSRKEGLGLILPPPKETSPNSKKNCLTKLSRKGGLALSPQKSGHSTTAKKGLSPNSPQNEAASKKEKEKGKSSSEAPLTLTDGSTSNWKAVITSPAQKLGPGEDRNKVRCKVCNEWFPNRYFQRKHMLMEHEDQLYECRVCSFNSVDPEKLKSHIIKLHVTKKEKSESVSLDSLQEELEKLIDKKVPRKVMMEDGVTLGRDVNSKMRYVCALCNRIYTSKYSLERHVRCHTLEKPYHCDVCSFTSSYREHMMRHMTSVHLIVHSNAPKIKYVPKKKKDDDPKSEAEANEEELMEEEETGEADESSEVPEQQLSSDDKESSPSKKRRNILRERFECAVCGLRSTHKTDLIEHIKTRHPNAHIESLESNDGSKVHLIVTMAKKPKPTKRLTIQCTYCFLIFHDTWKYRVHLRSHTGVKPFQCSLCEFRATSKMTVRDHIHRRHKNAADAKILLRTVSIDGSVEQVELAVPWREFKCEHCSKQFNDNYNLKLHKQKEHLEALPFFCIICSHKELTKAGMVVHCSTNHKRENMDSIILRNGKPCKVGSVSIPTCDFCDKVFAYRSQLNIHLKVHTGEKAFNCEHCDYKTNIKNYLVKHVQKIHFGIDTKKKSTAGRKKNVEKTKNAT